MPQFAFRCYALKGHKCFCDAILIACPPEKRETLAKKYDSLWGGHQLNHADYSNEIIEYINHKQAAGY